MKRYEIALFDLDGTLSESGEGILECVRLIFTEMNRPMPSEEEIAAFIGPPMYDSLKRCGFSDEDARLGVEIYKRNYVQIGIFKNKIYEGIPEVLQTLKNQGVCLGVASSKYQKFTDRIIRMLRLESYFDVVGGSNALIGENSSEKPRHSKIEVMEYVIDCLRQTDDDRVVMIGDTRFDAEGAAALKTGFIGCLYGYGSRQEMLDAYSMDCPLFAKTPLDIVDFILCNNA